MNECPNCLDNSIIPNFRNFRDKMFLRVKNMIKFKWISNQFPLIQFMRFSRQVYWGALPFPPLVDHILSELSTMTCLSWVPPHGMAYSFTELASPFAMTRQWSMKGREWGMESWHSAVHGVTQSWTRLGGWTTTTNFHFTCPSCFYSLENVSLFRWKFSDTYQLFRKCSLANSIDQLLCTFPAAALLLGLMSFLMVLGR